MYAHMLVHIHMVTSVVYTGIYLRICAPQVYLPCCLVTKKRYVGNAYFTPSGPPTFDAKVKRLKRKVPFVHRCWFVLYFSMYAAGALQLT